MKATETKLLTFLMNSPQFIIPIYQRTYSWTEKECRQLWDDILRAGREQSIPVHFIGSVVYIEQGLSAVTSRSPLLVIDGQQRLTTVTLLLAALADILKGRDSVGEFNEGKTRNYYLVNAEEVGDAHYKLLLSQTDRNTLTAIVGKREGPDEPSLRIKENYENFKKWLTAKDCDLEIVGAGLLKLMIVDIALNREHDNPQLIFESLNSTGRELSQADLIRNFVLMGLEPELQTQLYGDYWRPMEMSFGQESYGTYFDGFMRHYLTVRTGAIPRLGDVYEAYKDYARKSEAQGVDIEALVREVRDYARSFCAIALLRQEQNPKLSLAFRDLRELRVDVAYPFLLELYTDYRDKKLSGEDFHEIVRLVDAYVFRRRVMGIPTNSMNKTFSTFSKALRKDRYLESVKAHFLGLSSYRRFPRDEEFRKSLETRDLYNFRNISYCLMRLENHDRKERVAVDDYTIEHIMPQNENLSQSWQNALGGEWKRVQEEWLHSLGNLTLTGYNSEYRDKPFAEKRDMEGGFAESPLKVNEGLGQQAEWNEDAIRQRAQALSQRALQVWVSPELSDAILSDYQKPVQGKPSYSVDDHPHLVSGPARALFDQLRTEVMALNPCVTEEFLKQYVGYKAETNFVDIIPQAAGLLLSLNIDPSELRDRRSVTRDVSNIGGWGNGKVEYKLQNADDLNYAVGLVRQSLEQQLGSVGGD